MTALHRFFNNADARKCSRFPDWVLHVRRHHLRCRDACNTPRSHVTQRDFTALKKKLTLNIEITVRQTRFPERPRISMKGADCERSLSRCLSLPSVVARSGRGSVEPARPPRFLTTNDSVCRNLTHTRTTGIDEQHEAEIRLLRRLAQAVGICVRASPTSRFESRTPFASRARVSELPTR